MTQTPPPEPPGPPSYTPSFSLPPPSSPPPPPTDPDSRKNKRLQAIWPLVYKRYHTIITHTNIKVTKEEFDRDIAELRRITKAGVDRGLSDEEIIDGVNSYIGQDEDKRAEIAWADAKQAYTQVHDWIKAGVMEPEEIPAAGVDIPFFREEASPNFDREKAKRRHRLLERLYRRFFEILSSAGVERKTEKDMAQDLLNLLYIIYEGEQKNLTEEEMYDRMLKYARRVIYDVREAESRERGELKRAREDLVRAATLEQREAMVVRFAQALQAAQADLRAREDDLRAREADLRAREAALREEKADIIRREEALIRKEEWLKKIDDLMNRVLQSIGKAKEGGERGGGVGVGGAGVEDIEAISREAQKDPKRLREFIRKIVKPGHEEEIIEHILQDPMEFFVVRKALREIRVHKSTGAATEVTETNIDQVLDALKQYNVIQIVMTDREGRIKQDRSLPYIELWHRLPRLLKDWKAKEEGGRIYVIPVE
ncbi:MAG: hypothetical protein QXM92_02400 [Candidatus Anstonellales archaeon]